MNIFQHVRFRTVYTVSPKTGAPLSYRHALVVVFLGHGVHKPINWKETEQRILRNSRF